MTDIETHDGVTPDALWAGDSGTLPDATRRAIVDLIRGPYVTADKSSWAAIVDDQAVVRSRLHDLFLDLVIDPVAGFAFVRTAQTGEFAAPKSVRSAGLTFIDTAMLLVLRQLLLAHGRDGRAIVGRDEVYEQVRVFRTADRDEHDFDKRMNSSWQKMINVLRVVHVIGKADDIDVRVEISPVLRLLVDDATVRAVQEVYRGLIGGASEPATDGETSAPDERLDDEEPDDEESAA